MLCYQKPSAWTTKAGEPCRQGVSDDPAVPGCVHHRGDPEAVKAMQQRGGFAFAANLKVRRGAVPENAPDLTLGTVAEIDQEIARALEQLRRGTLSERRAEVLIASLQKLRQTKHEEAPKPGVNVSIGSSYFWKRPLSYCPKCGYEAVETPKPNGIDHARQ